MQAALSQLGKSLNGEEAKTTHISISISSKRYINEKLLPLAKLLIEL